MAIVVNFKLENMRPRLTYPLSSRTMNVGGVSVWIPASKKGSGSHVDYQKIADKVICPPSYLLAFSSMHSFLFLFPPYFLKNRFTLSEVGYSV